MFGAWVIGSFDLHRTGVWVCAGLYTARVCELPAPTPIQQPVLDAADPKTLYPLQGRVCLTRNLCSATDSSDLHMLCTYCTRTYSIL